MSSATAAKPMQDTTTNKADTKQKGGTVRTNAFAGAGSRMSEGVAALFENTGAQQSLLPLDMIEIKAQIREEFEDAENSLDELAADIKARGVMQPILVRPTATGYELVAGERRYRASKLAGLTDIPAYIRDMTDEEAEDAQLAENIHRKNLTQTEEAKKIQRDLDKLGSVEAVLAKHHKSRAWLSKILGLLTLPEHAKRLVAENITSDVEVIGAVKVIERADPAAAKALVDDLKKTRGKESARAKVAAVKEIVKPSGKAKQPGVAGKSKAGGSMATPRDRSAEDPGAVREGAAHPGSALDRVYVRIYEQGSSPKSVLDGMEPSDKELVEAYLSAAYDAGKKVKDLGGAVIQGFRSGQFACDGSGAFALVAFLYGADSEAKFNMLNIFGSVKE